MLLQILEHCQQNCLKYLHKQVPFIWMELFFTRNSPQCLKMATVVYCDNTRWNTSSSRFAYVQQCQDGFSLRKKKKKKGMVIKLIVKSFKCKFIRKLIKYQKNLSNRDETRAEQEKNTQVKWYTRKMSEWNDIEMPGWKYPQHNCLKNTWNLYKSSTLKKKTHKRYSETLMTQTILLLHDLIYICNNSYKC